MGQPSVTRTTRTAAIRPVEPRISPLLLRTCAHVDPVGARCTAAPVGMIVTSLPATRRPDTVTYWCRDHLDLIDLAAVSSLLPRTTSVALRSAS